MKRLAAAVLAAFLLVTAPAFAAECLRTLRGIDLQSATIPELQGALSDGRITSEQLVEAYVGRIAAYDAAGPKLNSVRQLHPAALDQARAADAERRAGRVRGPLHGIPFLLKDNVATGDMPTTAGSIALEGVVPKRDATLTARLRQGGAIILGKANLSEFANWVDLDMPNGYSSLGGQVRNAHDLGDPSGSSAGSGVAASMAFSGATIGTETSGSILSPSEANGVVGVKTTLGMVSRAGILPLAESFDVPGPMVRSVTDAANVLTAIAGPDERDPATADAPKGVDFAAGLKRDALKGKRLAYSGSAYDSLSDEEQALFDTALERVERLGGTTVRVNALDAQYAAIGELGAIPNEFKAGLNQYLADEMPASKRRSLSEIIAFNETRPDRVKYGQDLLEASDATPGRKELFPVQAEPVRRSARADIDAALTEGDADAILAPGNVHANVGAAAGYPTVMVPLGYTNKGKRPQGLGFLGSRYTEAQLLALAYAFEQAGAARVAPTAINPKLVPGTCPAVSGGGSTPASPSGDPVSRGGETASGRALPATRILRPLRVSIVRRRGGILRVTVRGAAGAKVRLTLRRGKRTAVRRTVRVRTGVARTRFRIRGRRGAYRVTVTDLGPPTRTSRSRLVRVR